MSGSNLTDKPVTMTAGSSFAPTTTSLEKKLTQPAITDKKAEQVKAAPDSAPENTLLQMMVAYLAKQHEFQEKQFQLQQQQQAKQYELQEQQFQLQQEQHRLQKHEMVFAYETNSLGAQLVALASSATLPPTAHLDSEMGTPTLSSGPVSGLQASNSPATSEATLAKRPLTPEVVAALNPRKELSLHTGEDDAGDSKREAKTAAPLRVFQAPPATADFTGRTQLLEELAKTFHQGHSGVVSQGIAGSGGFGKTQLAARYVQLAAAKAFCGGKPLAYDAVVWLYAERELFSQFQSLAHAWFGLSGLSPQEALLAVHQQLKAQRVLLVLDNAFEASSLTPILSQLSDGHYHVLITSRERTWGDMPLISLNGFSKEEGAAYVRQHLADAKTDEVTALLEALQYIPLSLKHAVAYIQAGACSIGDYSQTVAALRGLHGKGPATASQTVLMTVLITLERLRSRYPAFAALSLAAAYLAPEAIPRTLLQTGLAQHAESALQESLSALLAYGLVQATGTDTITMHRLVQEAVRTWHLQTQGEAEVRTHVLHWVRHLATALEFDDKDLVAIRRIQMLIPHAWAVAEACPVEDKTLDNPAGKLKEGLPPLALLFHQIGYHQQVGVGDYRQALRADGRALALIEQHYPTDHPEVATALGHLAATYHALSDYKKALPLEERALAIKEKHYPADHPSVARALGNLALTYRALGDPKRAQPLQEWALAIDEKHYPADHPMVATALGNLAATYGALGDHKKALPIEERALAIKEKHYPADHPEVAIALGNLALTYSALGDLKRALPIEERALAIDEKHYPVDHPMVVLAVWNLAMTCCSIGDKAKARVLFRRAHGIYKLQHGADHVMTRKAAAMLASLVPESAVSLQEGKVSVPASFGRGSPIVSSPAMSAPNNTNAAATRVEKSNSPTNT